MRDSLFRRLLGSAMLPLALAATACGADMSTAGEPVEELSEAVSLGRLNIGDYLFASQVLWSPNGAFSLNMQGDGNLVERDAVGNAVWSSGTSGNSRAYVNLQGDGNFVLRASDDDPLWATNTSNADSVRLGEKGQLTVYSGNINKYFNGVNRTPTTYNYNPRSEVTKVYHHKTYTFAAVLETSNSKSSDCGHRCSSGPHRERCKAWAWSPDNICRLLDRTGTMANTTGAHYGEKWICNATGCQRG